jgi:hypothetical protein
MMICQLDVLLLAGLLLAAGVPTFDQDALAQGTTVPQRNNQGSPAGIVPEPPTGTEITRQGSPGFVQSLVVGDPFEVDTEKIAQDLSGKFGVS